MIDHRVSRRYAGALMNLVREQRDLDRVDADFTKIRQMIDRYPEITHLAVNSTISRTEKDDLINKFFGPEMHALLISFLKVLVAKRRFSQIKNIQEEFHRLYEKQKGIQHVEVISAVAMASKTEERLIRVLQKKLNAEIRLEAKIDPSLLGGLIIRFDGNEINESFKGRFLKMRQLLMA